MNIPDDDDNTNTPPNGSPVVPPTQPDPPVPPPAQAPVPPALPNTGPLDALGAWWANLRKSQQTGPQAQQAGPTLAPPVLLPVRQRSAIEKMRDTVAEMDEDYKGMGERILGFFLQLVGYIGPFALVLWIGSPLGKYYAPVMDAGPAYGLAYTIECIIAGLTIAMGRSFAEIASGKANWSKAVLVIGIWLVLNASSAFGVYLVISGGHAPQGIEGMSMVIRVCAVALGDLGCSAMLMFKGQSMQKHIESVRKRATAIGELADAQRSIEEADKNAALREQMMQATLKIQEDMSKQIGKGVEMVMESILSKMEKSLQDDDTKNERGYGRR